MCTLQPRNTVYLLYGDCESGCKTSFPRLHSHREYFRWASLMGCAVNTGWLSTQACKRQYLNVYRECINNKNVVWCHAKWAPGGTSDEPTSDQEPENPLEVFVIGRPSHPTWWNLCLWRTEWDTSILILLCPLYHWLKWTKICCQESQRLQTIFITIEVREANELSCAIKKSII